MYQYFTPFYDSTVFHFKDIIFFIHSSINEHFDFFNLLNIVNSAAVNNMQVLFEQLFSILLDIYLGMESLDPTGFSGDSDNKESTCQRRRHKRQRHGFDPWIGKIPWRQAWQPTPVFLPGESHGQRHLVGYGPWSRKESDTTEQLTLP